MVIQVQQEWGTPKHDLKQTQAQAKCRTRMLEGPQMIWKDSSMQHEMRGRIITHSHMPTRPPLVSTFPFFHFLVHTISPKFNMYKLQPCFPINIGSSSLIFQAWITTKTLEFFQPCLPVNDYIDSTIYLHPYLLIKLHLNPLKLFQVITRLKTIWIVPPKYIIFNLELQFRQGKTRNIPTFSWYGLVRFGSQK